MLHRGIPVARFLVNLPALLEHLRLTADFVGQAVVEVFEGVHVLELGLYAELGRPAAAQADVAVAAHGAFLHRAVGDADGEEDLVQLLHEQARFLGRAQVGLGDELDERRARTVVVDKGMRCARDAALVAADVNHLARVFLHMDARDAHVRRVAGVGHGDVLVSVACAKARDVGAFLRRRAVDVEVEMTAHAECYGALRGLEVLRHVGVHVVLAVEHGVLLDVAVRGEAREHDRLDGGLVRHGKGAGQAQAHGAGVRVGCGAELQLAAAEHLRGKGGELGVDFQADDRFPILQYLLELLHATRLPFRSRIRAPRVRCRIPSRAPSRRGTCSRP